MKKFYNTIEKLFDESILGVARAHKDILKLNPDPCYITRIEPTRANKVAVISGGGAGHEPLHAGFVGFGMLDAACPGQTFTSPTPDQMMAAAEEVNNGAGVLFVVKNYAGDVMNFEIGAEMADCESVSVIVEDDVSLPKDHPIGRRGVAGTLIVEKMVGAAAESGLDLAACKAIGDRVVEATASMGVALTSCTIPALGEPTFELAEDEMEIGVGIHGERGIKTMKLGTASEVVAIISKAIEDDLKPQKGQRILLHVNGLGATPPMEQYLIFDFACQYFEERGVIIERSLVGNYTTALDMAGISITVTLLDDELISLWDAPVSTANLRWGM
ncbi:MAG: dihydroxyacetone kinase subunit DhaK [Methyloprofundus sp.]|nr:dihydroxyacetone kinase subunit DhaK [Methyloprofundus sp.]